MKKKIKWILLGAAVCLAIVLAAIHPTCPGEPDPDPPGAL